MGHKKAALRVKASQAEGTPRGPPVRQAKQIQVGMVEEIE
jgi:hypothetical protein